MTLMPRTLFSRLGTYPGYDHDQTIKKSFVSLASHLKGSAENSNFEKLKIPNGTVFTIREISQEKCEKFL